MNELEFPWELEIENMRSIIPYMNIDELNNFEVKFIVTKNQKVYRKFKDLLKVENSKIKILELNSLTNNSLGIDIKANSTGPIPYIKNLTNVSWMFSLSSFETIPDDLFKYNPQIRKFNQCFKYCEKLIQIPQNLFKYSTNAIDYSNVFSDCTSLTEVPSGLFKYGDNKLLDGAFRNCIYLKKINGNIFSDDIELDRSYFERIFHGCSNLKDMPQEILFKLI